jgi:serine/threonine-protein kinase
MEEQVLGNYRIVRKLGEGGMGSVYEAVHMQIGRRAAIKVLHPQYAKNEQMASRFVNEARAANIVQHPGIVGIFEIGQLPDKTAYIIMEYLEGEPLSHRRRRMGGKLGADALRIGRQIASALAAAHERGIVHRDLKPDNVMLVPDAESLGGERAKLLDFGIAKMAEGDGGSHMKTRTGVLMGTPIYMSPEQCRGAGSVDAKTDVYALGIILYELLGGKPPFNSPGLGEMLALHMLTPPQPLRELEPAVPEELAALVHGMLAKAPEQRPTMVQVVQALEQLGAPPASPSLAPINQSGVLALPRTPSQAGSLPPLSTPSTLGQASGQSAATSTSRRGIVIGAAAALTLAAAGLGSLALNRRPAQAPRVHWSVTSAPAGAQVIRQGDGAVLGRTPFQSERAAGTGTLRAVLRLPGYIDRRIELDLSANTNIREQLEPLPAQKAEQRPKAEATTAAAAETPDAPDARPAKEHRERRSGKGERPPREDKPKRVIRDDEIELLK